MAFDGKPIPPILPVSSIMARILITSNNPRNIVKEKDNSFLFLALLCNSYQVLSFKTYQAFPSKCSLLRNPQLTLCLPYTCQNCSQVTNGSDCTDTLLQLESFLIQRKFMFRRREALRSHTADPFKRRSSSLSWTTRAYHLYP